MITSWQPPRARRKPPAVAGLADEGRACKLAYLFQFLRSKNATIKANPHSRINSVQASVPMQFLPSCCDAGVKIIAKLDDQSRRLVAMSADWTLPP